MQYRSGDLLARIISDVDTLENFYVRLVAPPLVAVVVAAIMTVFLSRFEARLAWSYLAFMVALGLGVPLILWTLGRRAGAELISRRAAFQSSLVDGLQGLADLLAFGRDRDYSGRLASEGKATGRTQAILASVSGFSNGMTVLLVNFGMLAVLVLTIPLVSAGRIPAVLLAALALAAQAGFEAVIPLPQAVQTLSSSLQAARRLFEVVDARPEVPDMPTVIECPLVSPTIEFSKVSFAYPGSTENALAGIDISLPPGKHIAIVGPSGAGKSTLGTLLLRFWDYSHGKILLDGRDLHEYAQEDVRRLVSVISQKPAFFHDTIHQNLLLARPSANQSQVRKAVQQAQLDEFINGLPQGYETVIGERGLRLSGGERQRLALARALLKDAPVFLLDEPTANLDPLTERLILETFYATSKDRSLLVITHRLVGLEHMDEIIVLDHGTIVERGSHSELLASGGLYCRMWDFQRRILVE